MWGLFYGSGTEKIKQSGFFPLNFFFFLIRENLFFPELIKSFFSELLSLYIYALLLINCWSSPFFSLHLF